MSLAETLAALRAGDKPQFPSSANSLEYARSMDAQDPLKHLRSEYIIPSKAMIKKRKLEGVAPQDASQNDPAVYFCGNSLGLQPKATRRFVEAQLETWGSIGVQGHFVSLDDSPLSAWQDMVATCSAQVANIVGASASEVVIMNTLTANLHLLMASFYKPTEKRHKIIAEWKPFPSDSYAIESQLDLHGLSVKSSLVELQPDDNMYISTDLVLKTIDEHAQSAALLLLPGIQYYSGQLFDIKKITAYARSKGIVVGWDLAHAIGNVELQLHDWDIDFAVWCTYKYVNSGPGGIAGAFVHEKHGAVTKDDKTGQLKFHPRLSGWYGCDVSVRFNMSKDFQPTPGAQGFQVSNPSAMDLASLGGSLSVFDKTSVKELRDKSLVLTAYAEHLLNGIIADSTSDVKPFKIITPANPMERGAQLSVWLKAGTMPAVGEALDQAGIILDQRKPDVIRIAPVPMYNTFEEVFTVIDVLRRTVL